MVAKLALIHAVPSLLEIFRQLCKEIIPQVELINIVDETLLKMALAQDGLSPAICRRMRQHIEAAEDAGADIVLLTCTSFSACLEAKRPFVGIPIVKIDEPMIDKALELGMRIGIVATARTTIDPTTNLVRARAAAINMDVEVISALCEGAYDALFAGDIEKHDIIVRQTIEELMPQSDVIVLAQASMAHVGEAISAGPQIVPVLSSPRLGIEHIAQLLNIE